MLIKTKRCTVRPFAAGDIDDFMAYRNDDDWMKYQGYKNQAKETYERDLLRGHSLVDGAQLAIISDETGRCIGDVYLHQEDNTLWIGYTIAPPNARQGYALEVAGAVIGWAKAKGYTAIKAGVMPDNAPSIRLLERLGFCYMGMDGGERIYAIKNPGAHTAPG